MWSAEGGGGGGRGGEGVISQVLLVFLPSHFKHGNDVTMIECRPPHHATATHLQPEFCFEASEVLFNSQLNPNDVIMSYTTRSHLIQGSFILYIYDTTGDTSVNIKLPHPYYCLLYTMK